MELLVYSHSHSYSVNKRHFLQRKQRLMVNWYLLAKEERGKTKKHVKIRFTRLSLWDACLEAQILKVVWTKPPPTAKKIPGISGNFRESQNFRVYRGCLVPTQQWRRGPLPPPRWHSHRPIIRAAPPSGILHFAPPTILLQHFLGAFLWCPFLKA